MSLVLCLILTGCKVGPDYQKPLMPMPLSYSEDRLDKTESLADEDFFCWWKTFNDPLLNKLLEEAIQGNFDYLIALERVLQARSQYWITATEVLPSLQSDMQASHFRTSQSFAGSRPALVSGISPIQNFFQAGFDAVWQIDLFGGLRRAASASFDEWQATEDDARGVKIVILSEVANTYAAIAAYQRKAEIALQIVESDEELLAIAADRFHAGLGAEQDVQAFTASLEADRASLELNRNLFKQNVYALAVLLGRTPESLPAEFDRGIQILKSTDRVPAGLPGSLLRRRPDVRSAERRLASATEQIGVAVAALFPQISLTGSSSSFAANPLQGANIGFSSDKASKLFTNPSRVWGIGAIASWTVFDWGQKIAQVDLQESIRNGAYWNYQKTVIQALQDVEQALSSYFSEEEKVKYLTKSEGAYRKTLELASDNYQAGLSDYTAVLQAKEAYLNSSNLLADSEKALATDLIAVYKALGGDW